MNATSASPSEPQPGDATAGRAPGVLIWDAPVRVFHWLMVLCFAGAWLSAESERWRLLHVTLGYTMAGLVAFRLVWGLIGSRTARFAEFVRGPRPVFDYLAALLRGQPQHHSGHNPAGALAIVALLLLTLAVVASGWALFDGPGGEWAEELHEGAANTLMAVAGVHLAGVLLASWLHHENLVRAMFTGHKRAAPGEALSSAWRSVALLMLAAVLGYWWLQWRAAGG